MVTRHRVNLSLSELEYQQLSQLAASQGKTPSTLIADVIRFMMFDSVRQTEAAKTALEASDKSGQGVSTAKAKKTAAKPVKSSRKGVK